MTDIVRPAAAVQEVGDRLPTPRRVGWIGLGDQGAPMARAIGEAGFELHVWVRREASLTALAGVDHIVHDDVQDLARSTDALALCLREDSDIESVVLDSGLLDNMAAGSILINHGTGLPVFAVRLAARAAEREVAALDAPVSGGRPGAEAHALTTIVGGDPGALDRMKPVFESFSKKIAHMGDPGAGQTGKLINNALLMLNQQSVRQILELAAELALDTQALIDLLLSSTGSSFALQALGGAITEENAAHLAELQIIDMDLFDAALRSFGLQVPDVSASARQGAAGLPLAARLAAGGRADGRSAPGRRG